MCGIFGVINFNGQHVDKEKVLSARDILAHRGPDDSGLYLSSYNHTSIQSCVALAHRRLSIIDLSPSAHQPMTTEDGRFTIVFNGEIFNYEELREPISSKQLAVSQNQFRTNSDTAVILKLYAMEGSDCLKRLRGMFAFAIWDDKEKKLFTARDRFGIKPFYYLHNDNEFIFSSELKAIKKYKNGLTLSMEGMDAFLKTGSVPAPLTIYEETTALLPGNYIEVRNHPSTPLRVTEKQYWSFFDLLTSNDSHTERSRSMAPDNFVNLTSQVIRRRSNLNYDDETKKIIRNSLLDSIKAHMVSDVEVGAFLSGGIDSTAIVSLMRQTGHDKIKTISVTFPGHQLDESKYSNLAAKKYETNHFEYRLQEDELINDFEKIIEAMDQPTIDGINTYFVSKAAASFGLKVVLSGLGGDELFGGYPSFINIPKYQRIKSLPFSRSLMKIAGTVLKGKIPAKAIEYFKNPNSPNAEYRMIRGLCTDNELRALRWLSEGQTSNGKWQMENALQPMTNAQFTNDPMTKDYFSQIVIASEAKQSLSPLQYISYLESCNYMRNQLLRDSDAFSMTHSLELRVPFVDHLLYANVLPYLDNGFDKSFPKKMLVDAVSDLPAEIVHRPKQGFTFPFADWIKKGKMKDSINDSLNSSKMKNYFNPQSLLNLNNEFQKNKIHWSRVWAMYVLSRF
ncbi:MAG: asparagine synthase (glutamine-hydrolyzing) [Ignavibacteriota bacterium]|nr:MAG: asparagine synthase (glutamine-hydrolyzing) [Ignavibacteriota bacterium]